MPEHQDDLLPGQPEFVVMIVVRVDKAYREVLRRTGGSYSTDAAVSIIDEHTDCIKRDRFGHLTDSGEVDDETLALAAVLNQEVRKRMQWIRDLIPAESCLWL